MKELTRRDGARRSNRKHHTRKRKQRPYSEKELRRILSASAYDNWIKDHSSVSLYNAWLKHILSEPVYTAWLKLMGEAEFNCGDHKEFTLHQLGYIEDFPTGEPSFNIKKYHPLDHKGTADGPLMKSDIPDVLKELDTGRPVVFYHDYNDYMGKTYHSLPKKNRYGNHVFVIVRGGDRYFVSQAYLYRYKHSLIGYTRKEIAEMLETVIDKLSDYDRDKRWRDIDFDAHRRYFRTELTAYPDIPLDKDQKVHGINLGRVFTKKAPLKNE